MAGGASEIDPRLKIEFDAYKDSLQKYVVLLERWVGSIDYRSLDRPSREALRELRKLQDEVIETSRFALSIKQLDEKYLRELFQFIRKVDTECNKISNANQQWKLDYINLFANEKRILEVPESNETNSSTPHEKKRPVEQPFPVLKHQSLRSYGSEALGFTIQEYDLQKSSAPSQVPAVSISAKTTSKFKEFPENRVIRATLDGTDTEIKQTLKEGVQCFLGTKPLTDEQKNKVALQMAQMALATYPHEQLHIGGTNSEEISRLCKAILFLDPTARNRIILAEDSKEQMPKELDKSKHDEDFKTFATWSTEYKAALKELKQSTQAQSEDRSTSHPSDGM